MKSKNSSIETFLSVLLTLARISETWDKIRSEVGDNLESVIDELSPETADRLLSLVEILDSLLLIFKGRIRTTNN